MEIDGEGSDRTHRSLSDFLVLWVYAHLLRWRDRRRQKDNNREERLQSLHGLLVPLVCADLLARLFALFAPLALLVFVPSVAVALLAVVPPSATAANGRRRTKGTKVTKGEERKRDRRAKRSEREDKREGKINKLKKTKQKREGNGEGIRRQAEGQRDSIMPRQSVETKGWKREGETR